MSSTRQLKSRIKSVKNNRQITKAMELVAASKLRRAQDAARATEPYARAARELLTQLSTISDVKRNMFFKPRPLAVRLVVMMTSDRGLAGAYNANVCKLAAKQIKDDRAAGVVTHVVCIGKKGAQFVAKIKGVEVVGVYHDIPEPATATALRPLLVDVIDRFLDGRTDAVTLIYTDFVSSVKQQAIVQSLLPATFIEEVVPSYLQQASFEPSVHEVLEGAVIRLLEAQVYQALQSARASEHMMRRVAMKNATDNAGELVEDLTLAMNKVRQAAITQELAEISGGVEAMKE